MDGATAGLAGQHDERMAQLRQYLQDGPLGRLLHGTSDTTAEQCGRTFWGLLAARLLLARDQLIGDWERALACFCSAR